MIRMKLGDVATFVSGGTPSRSVAEYYGGHIPWITGADIDDSGDISSRFWITTEAVQKSATNIVEAGALVLVTRTSVGKVALLDRATAISQDLTGVIPHTGISPNYIRHFLKLSARSLADQARGATIKGITRNVVASLMIPVPPLDEQRRIAGILDQADAIRTKRRASLALLDELTQSVFLDLSVSSEPQKMRFGDLVQNFRNGLSPSNSGEFGAQVLTLGAITHGRFDPTSRRAAMFDRIPEENVRVRKQDFLVCRGNGNIDLVGQGVFPQSDDDQVVFPDTMIACRLDADKIRPPYLAALWGQRVVRQQIEAGARTTNGTFKINQKILGDVSLPIPPLAVQQEFAARVEQINAQRALVERALEKDEELFASLQSRAFSGEL
ncbi:restriction endonuclease subunit S [Kocuria rhizophila]|uniref:restriction endonuclease subunit S n=2 Tax=Kocuria TaxID=57493 RepID=UPI000EF1CFED|nr:restriction endonuclease subunit S [Kocuria rhizophila]RLP59229.1 restriction endonuclease subunit S [Kocuria rhizophila]